MDLQFERGSAREPKGHALVYFRSSLDAEQVLATYFVVLPIPLEIGKYLPPLFAAGLPGLTPNAASVVPMPPVPEQVPGLPHLIRLAEARDDDLIFAGHVAPSDLQLMLQTTSELAQRYLNLYDDFVSTLDRLESMLASQPAREPELNVHEVMYGLMGEHDRLQELSKLTGQLRYAIDGGDANLASDTVAQMERLGKHFPAKYRMAEFIKAAQAPGEHGRRLAALYMDRCYKLYHEDYAGLSTVEAELKELRDS